jgi:hypothetical protein
MATACSASAVIRRSTTTGRAGGARKAGRPLPLRASRPSTTTGTKSAGGAAVTPPCLCGDLPQHHRGTRHWDLETSQHDFLCSHQTQHHHGVHACEGPCAQEITVSASPAGRTITTGTPSWASSLRSAACLCGPPAAAALRVDQHTLAVEQARLPLWRAAAAPLRGSDHRALRGVDHPASAATRRSTTTGPSTARPWPSDAFYLCGYLLQHYYGIATDLPAPSSPTSASAATCCGTTTGCIRRPPGPRPSRLPLRRPAAAPLRGDDPPPPSAGRLLRLCGGLPQHHYGSMPEVMYEPSSRSASASTCRSTTTGVFSNATATW